MWKRVKIKALLLFNIRHSYWSTRLIIAPNNSHGGRLQDLNEVVTEKTAILSHQNYNILICNILIYSYYILAIFTELLSSKDFNFLVVIT